VDFYDSTFDIIWCSHVLEHTINPGLMLDKMHSLLNYGGKLCISVPPYKSKIVGGHLSTGWNLGQLIYVLLSSGFWVKDGSYIENNINVFALVHKKKFILPTQHYDVGDLELLSNYWPIKFYQGIEGRMSQINWPPK
jgi:SAM-dependent methyltransferase